MKGKWSTLAAIAVIVIPIAIAVAVNKYDRNRIKRALNE